MRCERWSSSLLLALLLLAGCVTTHAALVSPRSVREAPPGRSRVEVPGVPPPDPTITQAPTLAQLLAYADLHAPDVLVARQRAQRGNADVIAASPLLPDNPEIGVAAGPRTIDSQTSVQLEASVSQRLEIAGQRGLRLDAAHRSEEAGLAELDVTRWQVQVLVRRLFYASLLATARRSVAESTVSFAQGVVDIAQRRVETGDEPEMSLLVPQADLAQAREQLVAATQEVRAARLELAQAIGWPSARPLEPSGALPGVRHALSPERLLPLALDHLPGVRSAEANVNAAEARVRLEDRMAWPDPALGVSYAREGEVTGATNIWLLTLGVPVPLWNRNQGARARARVDLDVARAEADRLRATLTVGLQQAVSAVNAAADRVGIYGTDIVPTIQQNLALVRRAFEAGQIDAERVSITLDRVLSTQRQALQAQEDYYRALGELEAILGTTLPDHEDQR